MHLVVFDVQQQPARIIMGKAVAACQVYALWRRALGLLEDSASGLSKVLFPEIHLWQSPISCSCLLTRGRRRLHCRSRSTKSSEVRPFLPLGGVRENVLKHLKPSNEQSGWLIDVCCRFGACRKSQVVEKASSWSQAFSLFDRQASDVISCLSSMLTADVCHVIPFGPMWFHAKTSGGKMSCTFWGFSAAIRAGNSVSQHPELNIVVVCNQRWNHGVNICPVLAPVFISLIARGRVLIGMVIWTVA